MRKFEPMILEYWGFESAHPNDIEDDIQDYLEGVPPEFQGKLRITLEYIPTHKEEEEP